MINKDELKSSLSVSEVAMILSEFGADPIETVFGLTSLTICHNHPNSKPSRKLYYYSNSNLFHCYTGCTEPSFDIFEVIIKASKIQKNEELSLIGAIYFVLNRLGISENQFKSTSSPVVQDEFLKSVENIIEQMEFEEEKREITLEAFKDTGLEYLPSFRILDWEEEGISYETVKKFNIRYFSPTDKIVIPHYDINNRLIGIRGRAILKEDAERFGKYMPLTFNGKMYNHPLGWNLYGIDKNKDAIKETKKAIIFEGEKSVLMYDTLFDSNIAVAACGSSISNFQFNLLIDLGIDEIIIAFDRQYREFDDEDSKMWETKLAKIGRKYKDIINISVIFDTEHLLGYKDSPIDCGKDIFLELYNGRVTL